MLALGPTSERRSTLEYRALPPYLARRDPDPTSQGMRFQFRHLSKEGQSRIQHQSGHTALRSLKRAHGLLWGMRRAGPVPLSLLLMILALPARAQVQLGAEVGVAQLRQTGFPETGASTLGVNLDAFARHGIVRASGLTTLGANDAWTGQALGAASLFGPVAARFEWELAG